MLGGRGVAAPRWPADGSAAVSWFVVCWSLPKVDAKKKKIVEIFSKGNSSNCLGSVAKSYFGFFRCMAGINTFVAFGVHNYAKCKSPKPRRPWGQQSKLKAGTSDAPSRGGQHAYRTRKLNRPHSLRWRLVTLLNLSISLFVRRILEYLIWKKVIKKNTKLKKKINLQKSFNTWLWCEKEQMRKFGDGISSAK